MFYGTHSILNWRLVWFSVSVLAAIILSICISVAPTAIAGDFTSYATQQTDPLLFRSGVVDHQAVKRSQPAQQVQQRAPTSQSNATCGEWSVAPSPNGPCCNNEIVSAYADSPDDIWAVGRSGGGVNQPYYSLTMHWDGLSWNYVESPNVGVYDTTLSGITAVSANDVWAVGNYFDNFTGEGSVLIMHWDGSEWTIVSSPDTGSFYSDLTGITAVSANDVWAVGSTRSHLLALHWNGTQWSIAPTPNVDGENITVRKVEALSANDIWAAGTYDTSNGSGFATLLIHWNGVQWSVVPSPDVPGNSNWLSGLSIISANDIWAVGYYGTYTTYHSLALHWDGAQWTIMLTPDVAAHSELYDVAAVSTNDVWAVGDYREAGHPLRTLIMHWDGSAWSVVPSQNQGAQSNTLYSVIALSSGAIWAAGNYYRIEGGNGVGWQTLVERYLDPCAPPTPTPTGTLLPNTPTPTTTPRPACPVGVWDSRASYPIPIMDQAVVVHEGVLYSFSGVSNGSTIPTSYKYDPGLNTWSNIVPLPGEREKASAVSSGAYIYIIGGWDANGVAQSSMYRYDPATNSYMQMPAFSMATAAQGAVYLNGKIYRIGGCTDNCDNITSSVEAFDIAANSWSTAAPLPQPLAWVMTTVYGNYFYTAGGIRPADTSKTYQYDPTNNMWSDSAIRDLPGQRWGAAFAMLNGKWVLAGGYASFQFTGSVISLDLSNPTGNWQDVASLPEARSRMEGGTLGTSLYVVGGRPTPDGFIGSGDNYRYSELPCLTPTITPTVTAIATTTSTPTVATSATSASASPTIETTSTPTRTPGASITATGTAVTSTTVPAPTQCTLQFQDVLPGSTFYSYIHCLACRDIVSGYADGTFRPENSVTRGQLSKIVSNAAGYQEPAGRQLFEDVMPGSTFYDFIQRLASRGFVNGYACGGLGEPCGEENLPYFRPANNSTRGQISKIVSNAAGYSEPSGNRIFEDVVEGSTFYEYVQRLASRAIMSGYACGGQAEPCNPHENRPYFRTANLATRGQTSKIVANTFYPNCQIP